MKFINIGSGNLVSVQRILSILTPDSAPIKRIVSEAKQRGMLIDASCGKKTESVIVMDSEHVILSAVIPQTLLERAESGERKETVNRTPIS